MILHSLKLHSNEDSKSNNSNVMAVFVPKDNSNKVTLNQSCVLFVSGVRMKGLVSERHKKDNWFRG